MRERERETEREREREREGERERETDSQTDKESSVLFWSEHFLSLPASKRPSRINPKTKKKTKKKETTTTIFFFLWCRWVQGGVRLIKCAFLASVWFFFGGGGIQTSGVFRAFPFSLLAEFGPRLLLCSCAGPLFPFIWYFCRRRSSFGFPCLL